jgi:hypothetical protein
MVSVLLDVASAHGGLPVAVSVSVTLPAAISAALGLYVAVVNEVGFVKVPVPLEVQVTPVLLVALEPPVILIAPELAHVDKFGPATAVGAAVTLIVLVDVAAVQPAGASVVKVNVTVPLKLAAGV